MKLAVLMAVAGMIMSSQAFAQARKPAPEGGLGTRGGSQRPDYSSSEGLGLTIMFSPGTAYLHLNEETARAMFENLTTATATSEFHDYACVTEDKKRRFGPAISCYELITTSKSDCEEKLGFKKRTTYACEIMVETDGTARSRNGGF